MIYMESIFKSYLALNIDKFIITINEYHKNNN
jgi:hypothetical protein